MGYHPLSEDFTRIQRILDDIDEKFLLQSRVDLYEHDLVELEIIRTRLSSIQNRMVKQLNNEQEEDEDDYY